MARIYNRTIRVLIGGEIEIENLVMSFEIKKEATGTPNDGNLTIFNLNESTETKIRRANQSIQIEAGYGTNVGTIFFGDIRRVERDRVGLNRLTKIALGGHVQTLIEAIFNKSYSGQTPVRLIVRDALLTFGLLSGNLNVIPENAVVEDFAWSAKTADCLDRLLLPLDIRWFESDGIIKLSKVGTVVDGNEAVVLNERTGMIGTPSATDKGIKIVSTLNPAIDIGTLLQVESGSILAGASGDSASQRALEVNGIYKTFQLVHRGDNWDGEFVSEMQAAPLNQ